MSFVHLQFKASRIKRLHDAYKQEKKWAMERDTGEEPELTLYQKYKQFCKRVRRNIRHRWSKICMSAPDSFLTKLKTFGTFENYILKSIIGFLGGMAMTYLLFMFFVFALNINLKMATIICIFIGPILALGLAFSMRVRCIVFLLLPVFVSKHGRQALVTCVFILVMTGPAKNALHNMGVLSESLLCGQESLKKAATELAEMIKQPFLALKAAIKDIMKTVKKVVSKLKDSLMAIRRAVMAILGVFKAAGEWLASIFNVCSKKVGTPFERCQKAFDGAILDCRAKLGPLFNWLCSIAYLTKLVCYVVKVFDIICMAIEVVGAIAENAMAGIKRKLNEFVSHLRGIFFVKVDFEHSFHFETNTSRGAEEITAGMVTEIQRRIRRILFVFDLMSWTFSLFFLFILIKVLHYRHKYMVSDRFDNHYITSRFRDIDMKRAQHDQETLLPLNRREKKIYIPISSLWLVYSERVKLTKSVVFLSASSFKMLIHLAIDYSLYWVLAQIRFHGRFQSEVEAPPAVHVKVEGEGAVSDIYRSTVKAFSPMDGSTQLDSVPCLPDPMPPNLSRYTQIGVLICFIWLSAFVEPYGLRLRQVVMSYYHPDRAAQRAVWLYNNVLRSRGSFLKFARRQLRRAAIGAADVERVTFMERLRASCPLLDRLLGASKQEVCLLCGHVHREGDEIGLVHCSKPGCIGKYCVDCYADLLNICTICMEPVEYGDLSDQDEEKDSSDEERPPRRRPKVLKQGEEPDVEAGLLDETDSCSSSDLSYSYQYVKFSDRPPSRDPSPTPPHWRDVERQYKDEPASLQDLHRDDVDADDALAERTPEADSHMADLLKDSSSLKIEREASRTLQKGSKTLTRDSAGIRQRYNHYTEVIAKELSRFFRMDSPATCNRCRRDLNARHKRNRPCRHRRSVKDDAEDDDNGAHEDDEGDYVRDVDDLSWEDGSSEEDVIYEKKPASLKPMANLEADKSKNEGAIGKIPERQRSEDDWDSGDDDEDGEVDGREEDDDSEESDSSEDDVVYERQPDSRKRKANRNGNGSRKENAAISQRGLKDDQNDESDDKVTDSDNEDDSNEDDSVLKNDPAPKREKDGSRRYQSQRKISEDKVDHVDDDASEDEEDYSSEDVVVYEREPKSTKRKGSQDDLVDNDEDEEDRESVDESKESGGNEIEEDIMADELDQEGCEDEEDDDEEGESGSAETDSLIRKNKPQPRKHYGHCHCQKTDKLLKKNIPSTSKNKKPKSRKK